MVVGSYSNSSSSSRRRHGSCIQLGLLLFLIAAYTCTALDSHIYYDQAEASVPFLEEAAAMLAHQAHDFLTIDKHQQQVQFQPFATAASAGHWDDDGDHTEEGEPELNALMVKQELRKGNLYSGPRWRKLLEDHDIIRSTRIQESEDSAASTHIQLIQTSPFPDTLKSHITKEGIIIDSLVNTPQTTKGGELVRNRPAAVAQYHSIPRPAPAAAASPPPPPPPPPSSSSSSSSSSSRGSSSIMSKHKHLRKRHRSSSRRVQVETQKATVTRRSSSAVEESGAFHVDYTAPRTHPPRNN